MTENDKGKREGIRDGLRQGVGILSAFKEAIEETIAEARERGDLRPERAKEAMRGALDKAQEAAGTARERFDFVTQKDFSRLTEAVTDLARRVTNLEGSSREDGDGPDDATGTQERHEPQGEVSADEATEEDTTTG